jgi:hypothetical protein
MAPSEAAEADRATGAADPQVDQASGSINSRPTKGPSGAQRPTPSAMADKAVDSLRFKLIEEIFDLLASYARSGAEAAFRCDKHTTGVHVKQTRLAVIEVIKTFNELSPESGDEAGRT